MDLLSIGDEAKDLIMESWQPTTHKQYGTYIKPWNTFCSERGADSMSPNINFVVDFLTSLIKMDLVIVLLI